MPILPQATEKHAPASRRGGHPGRRAGTSIGSSAAPRGGPTRAMPCPSGPNCADRTPHPGGTTAIYQG
eukprot:2009164-Pyramimonas_sp.AAC.1